MQGQNLSVRNATMALKEDVGHITVCRHMERAGRFCDMKNLKNVYKRYGNVSRLQWEIMTSFWTTKWNNVIRLDEKFFNLNGLDGR